MENRYATNPEEAKFYTTEELRERYLMENLFKEGQVNFTYTHEDRMLIGGAIPTHEPLTADIADSIKTGHFLERRELGVINIGSPGIVEVDGDRFEMQKRDCLYVGLGKKHIQFLSDDPDTPSRFYLVSTLAHKEYPTKKVAIEDAEPAHMGSIKESNERTIYKYVHGNGIQSCQLMLGMTLLEQNNMWNTMPAHVHDRRSEVYLYFDMSENGRVFHFMGEPGETRHLVVKNEQGIISPAWSIHSGVGTSNYTFIWAMAGENYTFTDMEFVDMEDLR
ncbi:5-dehydro-4-deoxy-D-glucuronate isomerase [Rossellomorea sp. NPDC077527]|uniref:5-dehydro-4-deoxy-D-glucuronate isomerase n=1 Tax=Rossellomorea sp. NPDC077527 TaxID=3364510 RepID=UPI0037C8DA58